MKLSNAVLPQGFGLAQLLIGLAVLAVLALLAKPQIAHFTAGAKADAESAHTLLKPVFLTK